MEQRFSVLSYADKRRRLEEEKSRRSGAGFAGPEGEDEWFRVLMDEVRKELAAPRGKTEEERRLYTDTLNRAVIGYEPARRAIMGMIVDILAKKRIHRPPPPSTRYTSLAEAAFAEIIGWNVLDTVLRQRAGLEEIQVIGEQVFEVRQGVPAPSPVRLPSAKDLERLQQNLVLFNGDSLHVRKKWAEVTLLDGARVTMTGLGFTSSPTLTIRFYSQVLFDLEQLSRPEAGTMSSAMAELLRVLVRASFNLVITGSTNSGKTTLIKALIREMPDHERLVTIESRYELRIKRDFPQKNCVEYEVDEDDPRHDGAQAFKLALRQSPKRIIHAEIRDQDAVLYVRACTRGHEGSMTTVHASALEDAPDAIADMCLMENKGMEPARLVRRIAQYVTQVGIEMAMIKGKRRITRIGEFAFSGGSVIVSDWVCYDAATNSWRYPLQLSQQAKERIRQADPRGYAALEGCFREKGGVDRCF
ncbi:Type IV secretion system protein VirB11 [compost metagenome]